jgi:hypothetical protein
LQPQLQRLQALHLYHLQPEVLERCECVWRAHPSVRTRVIPWMIARLSLALLHSTSVSAASASSVASASHTALLPADATPHLIGRSEALPRLLELGADGLALWKHIGWVWQDGLRFVWPERADVGVMKKVLSVLQSKYVTFYAVVVCLCVCVCVCVCV